jgi:hypothetical protein
MLAGFARKSIRRVDQPRFSATAKKGSVGIAAKNRLQELGDAAGRLLVVHELKIKTPVVPVVQAGKVEIVAILFASIGLRYG